MKRGVRYVGQGCLIHSGRQMQPRKLASLSNQLKPSILLMSCLSGSITCIVVLNRPGLQDPRPEHATTTWLLSGFDSTTGINRFTDISSDMAPSNIFSLPVPIYHQPRIPLKNGSHTRKRKRTDDTSKDQTNDVDTFREANQPQYVHSSQHSEYSAVLTPDERSQFRVAGQPFGQSPPPKPFPHAPQSKLDDSSRKVTSKRLANLDPPIYTPSTDSRSLPLHQQHLGAVTALLHRALSEGDFARARRALSLILRDEVGGRGLDIRAEGRWGIGAEILLRQGTQLNSNKTDMSEDTENWRNSEQAQAPWFTRKGFEDARKYYERLIVQYPFHTLNPGAVNALDFYPAMFGLWIHTVQAENEFNDEPLDDSTFSEVSHEENSAPVETRPRFTLASIQRTLAQAREIASRMDSCMTTLPYSDDFELIRLRGKVAWWIVDLIADLVKIQSTAFDESEENMQADVAAVNASADSADSALVLEADRAKQKAVEMQQKVQRHLNGLG